MKKIFAPPLMPLVIYVAFCLFGAIADRIGPETLIAGHADNAIRDGVVILLAMTPLIYLLFVLLNVLDAALHRVTRRFRWFPTLALTVAVASLLTSVLFRPEVDASRQLVSMACGSLVGAALVIVPMSLWRRKI